jgi:hypothetical protein
MSSKNIARLGQIENNNLEEVETGLVSNIPKPDSYLSKTFAKETGIRLAEDVHILRRLNN